MFPAYPLICFNAAVTLYLARGWLEVAYIKITALPYEASSITLSVLRGGAYVWLGVQGESFQQVHAIGDSCDITAIDFADPSAIQLLSRPAASGA